MQLLSVSHSISLSFLILSPHRSRCIREYKNAKEKHFFKRHIIEIVTAHNTQEGRLISIFWVFLLSLISFSLSLISRKFSLCVNVAFENNHKRLKGIWMRAMPTCELIFIVCVFAGSVKRLTYPFMCVSDENSRSLSRSCTKTIKRSTEWNDEFSFPTFDWWEKSISLFSYFKDKTSFAFLWSGWTFLTFHLVLLNNWIWKLFFLLCFIYLGSKQRIKWFFC